MPVSGTATSAWQIGHLILPYRVLVLAKLFRHSRQKMCKQGSCLGFVYKWIHTEQVTSSFKLCIKVGTSIMKHRAKQNGTKVSPPCLTDPTRQANRSSLVISKKSGRRVGGVHVSFVIGFRHANNTLSREQPSFNVRRHAPTAVLSECYMHSHPPPPPRKGILQMLQTRYSQVDAGNTS